MRRALQRHGAVGLAGHVASRLLALAYLNEQHVWYLLDLDRVSLLPLADGYELRLADDDDVALISGLETISADEARARRTEGAQLWLILNSGEAAFACWIFPEQTPVRAAATRLLELPPGVACLEDSFTGASHRGHGLAGAAWAAIAETLRGQGFKMLITKVEVENTPSRHAVEKANFRAASVMRLSRRGWRERVRFERQQTRLTPEEETTEAELERRLAR